MERQVTVTNKTGMHARPATRFISEAIKFKSNIMIEKDGKSINGKSIVGILSLGISKGSVIKIIAEGNDEEAALSVLVKLIESNLGEE